MGIGEFLFIYCIGAVGYGGLESLWRGETHWTMLLLGGLCFVCIYAVASVAYLPLPLKWLLCTFIITGLEFLTGCIVNLGLGWDVWDYSGIPGNVLGQICPLYTACWLLLSIPCSAFSSAIRRWIFLKKAR